NLNYQTLGGLIAFAERGKTSSGIGGRESIHPNKAREFALTENGFVGDDAPNKQMCFPLFKKLPFLSGHVMISLNDSPNRHTWSHGNSVSFVCKDVGGGWDRRWVISQSDFGLDKCANVIRWSLPEIDDFNLRGSSIGLHNVNTPGSDVDIGSQGIARMGVR